MQYALITGTARGLGLALVKQYLADGYTVFCGDISSDVPELQALQAQYGQAMELFSIDVSSTARVREVFETIKQRTERLDIVINNAGVLPRDSALPLEDVDIDGFLPTLSINTLGALRVIQQALPLLRRSEAPVVLNISSAGGSFKHIVELDDTTDDFPYAYCMSKAALNMESAILQRYCRKDGIKVLCVHPGGMKTRMNDHATEEQAKSLVAPEESAAHIAALAGRYKTDLNGPFFYNYTGDIFPY